MSSGRNEELAQLVPDGLQRFDIFVPVGVAEDGQNVILRRLQSLADVSQRQQRLVEFSGRDFAHSREAADEHIDQMRYRLVECLFISSEQVAVEVYRCYQQLFDNN